VQIKLSFKNEKKDYGLSKISIKSKYGSTNNQNSGICRITKSMCLNGFLLNETNTNSCLNKMITNCRSIIQPINVKNSNSSTNIDPASNAFCVINVNKDNWKYALFLNFFFS
jgi:hypothetical protein